MQNLDRKIKILYQTHPDIMGGTERLLLNLINNLDKKKFTPLVVSPKTGKTINMFEANGIKTIIIDTYSSKQPDKLIAFLQDSEIDIAQSTLFESSLALAANIAKVPHIWRIGGSIDIACPYLSFSRKKHFLNIMAILSKKIICPSKFLKQQFSGINFNKVDIIYNGVDFEEINAARQPHAFLKKYNTDASCNMVSMVANFSAPRNGTDYKRHIDFIRAAKMVKQYLPKTKFFIFGAAFPDSMSIDYVKKLHEKVTNAGMTKDIIFAGFRKNIFDLISCTDIVILPSIKEGAGYATIEAMALGKPVIAADSGANKENVIHKVTGLLTSPKNPKKLSEAIIELLKNPQKLKKMGIAGQKKAERLFDIKKLVLQYEKLYEDVYRKS